MEDYSSLYDYLDTGNGSGDYYTPGSDTAASLSANTTVPQTDTGSSGSGSGIWSNLSSLLGTAASAYGSLTGGTKTTTPTVSTTKTTTAATSTSMSSNTMMIILAAAAGLIALILFTRK